MRKHEIAIGLLIATAFWGLVFLWQSQKAPIDHGGQPAAAHNQKGAVASETTPAVSSKDDHGGKQQKRWYDTFAEHTAEWLIALFTGTLWFSTHRLWSITRDATRHTKTVERAYVKMSHRSDKAYALFDAQGEACVSIQVTNHGQTPANVTDAFVMYTTVPKVEDLPDVPVYKARNKSRRRHAFLVTNDHMYFTDQIGMKSNMLPVTGNPVLIAYGYVDYIDAFGARHRAGYARQWAPRVPGNNTLVFVEKPGYNYDRLRVEGEGDDWDESSK